MVDYHTVQILVLDILSLCHRKNELKEKEESRSESDRSRRKKLTTDIHIASKVTVHAGISFKFKILH